MIVFTRMLSFGVGESATAAMNEAVFLPNSNLNFVMPASLMLSMSTCYGRFGQFPARALWGLKHAKRPAKRPAKRGSLICGVCNIEGGIPRSGSPRSGSPQSGIEMEIFAKRELTLKPEYLASDWDGYATMILSRWVWSARIFSVVPFLGGGARGVIRGRRNFVKARVLLCGRIPLSSKKFFSMADLFRPFMGNGKCLVGAKKQRRLLVL